MRGTGWPSTRETRTMAVHLEFVVPGPSGTNPQRPAAGRANLRTRRGTIAGAARHHWPTPPLTRSVKAIIIDFYDEDEPRMDVDNMSKPILDVMQKIVYDNDRQVVQAELAHAKIGAAYHVLGVRPILV